MKNINNNCVLYIFLSLLLTFFYLTLFVIFPDYFSDDFTILKLIRDNNTFISSSPDDKFYLFFRPVTYLFFWVDYYVLNQNPIYSKTLSFFLLLTFSLTLYNLLTQLIFVLKIKVKKYSVLFIVLFISTNVIIVTSVIWIASRNEILMSLFYTLALLHFIKYIKTNNGTLLFLVFIFYLLSILSKQQSLHLPLLLLYFRYNLIKDKFLNQEKYFFVAMFLVMVFILAFNFHYTVSIPEIFFANLWKKGFWVINSLIYTFTPFTGDLLYNYFISNKSAAFIASGLSLILLLIILKKYPVYKNQLIFSIITYLITLFPIIFVEFTPRVISLSIIVSSVLILKNYNILNKTILFRLVFVMLILLNVIFSFFYSFDLKKYSLSESIVVNKYSNNIIYNTEGNLVISQITNLKERITYFSSQGNNLDSLVYLVPVLLHNSGFFCNEFAPSNTYSVEYKNGLICLNSKSIDYYIVPPISDTLKINNVSFVVSEKTLHAKRFLRSIVFKPLDYKEFNKQFKSLVYLNGDKWECINLSNNN